MPEIALISLQKAIDYLQPEVGALSKGGENG